MNRFFTRRMLCLAIVLGATLTAGVLLAPATGAKPPQPPPPPTPLPPFRYTLTWLAPLPGGSVVLAGSSAEDINDSGQVVGAAKRPARDDPTTLVGHAYVWTKEGGMVDLNDLLPPNSGWDLKSACAINNVGQIVGSGLFRDYPFQQGYRFTPGYTDDTGQWVPAIIERLETLGSSATTPAGINDLGDVTGSSGDSLGVSHAFVCRGAPGELGLPFPIDIGFPNLYSSRGAAINNAGEVTGQIVIRNDSGPRLYSYYAFRYTPPGRIEILALNAGARSSHISAGSDLNDDGDVVGWAFPKGTSATSHAFRYTGELGIQDLGTLDNGGSESTAEGVNRSGEVVGSAYSSALSFRGFIYIDAFGLINLDALLVNPDELWVVQWIRPHKINHWGDICGSAEFGNPFVLTREDAP